jgi:hypothetical protein
MKMSLKFLSLLLALASTSLAISQSTPPWSKRENDPAGQQGYVFLVHDVDNVPDLHGNPSDAKLVIYAFLVLPLTDEGIAGSRHINTDGCCNDDRRGNQTPSIWAQSPSVLAVEV